MGVRRNKGVEILIPNYALIHNENVNFEKSLSDGIVKRVRFTLC